MTDSSQVCIIRSRRWNDVLDDRSCSAASFYHVALSGAHGFSAIKQFSTSALGLVYADWDERALYHVVKA